MGRKLFSYCLCICLFALAGDRTGCRGQRASGLDDEAISKIPIVKFHDTSNNTLMLQEPIQMSLEGAQRVLFGVEVLKKEGITPDVVINTIVSNPGGDSDIFCNTWASLGEVGPPTAGNAPWGSNHTQGDDIVFISRTSSLYNDDNYFSVEVDGVTMLANRLVCTVRGAESEASETTVEIEIAYEYRELVEEEEDALLDMCRMCCTENSPCPCVGYNRDVDKTKEFLGGTEFCHEIGNVCTDQGHLLHLSLNKFNLTCDFPTEQIAQLKFLSKLDLSRNQLRGDVDKVAQGLSGLKNLNWVHLRQNKLSGRMLPDGGTCALARSGLIFMNLARNEIEGTVPSCLVDEDATLHELHLDENQLTGSLPGFETQVLEIFSASENMLTGEIPDGVGKVDHLRGIRLANNMIGGSIPSTLGLSKTLLVAHLDNNRLSGRIPDSVAAAPGLRELWLYNNQLTALPSAWEDGPISSRALAYLDVANNSISAGFPMGLARSDSIAALSISENNFSGPLPQTEGLFPSAVLLHFSHNQFSGSIPEEFGTIGWFRNATLHDHPFAVLDLSYNNLVGEIPEFLYDSEKAPSIHADLILDGNNLTCFEAKKAHSKADLPCLTQNESEQGKRKRKSAGAIVVTVAIIAVIVLVLLALVGAIIAIGTMRRKRAKQFEGIVGEMSLEPNVIKNSTSQAQV